MDNGEGEREYTRKKIIEQLVELKTLGDIEAAHYEADRLLCEALKACGCYDVVKAWEDVPKWYA